VSLASVLVLFVALFVIGSMVFISQIFDTTLNAVREKVDVNVYFVVEAQEADIFAIRDSLEDLPEVEEVGYVSREKALENFRDRHEGDEYTLQALEELDENPLGAILNIRAKEPSQYQSVADFLEGDNLRGADGQVIVDNVNYYENKGAIDKLNQIINSVEVFGFSIMLVLVLLAIAMTFNTIRLAIYISREEIHVMKLVGASAAYIRGPFIITGIIYGLVSGLIALIVFYPITMWLGGATESFLIGMNLFEYYITNFFQIFLVIVGSGIILGAISSYLAVAKYLKR